MASFVERVQIVIETKVKSAKQQISDLKSGIADAEGGVAKFKVAAGGVGDILNSAVGSLTSPAGLLAAGGALAGVAVKAVGSFQQLTLQVGAFRDATGASAEESSRFVEVFDDLGIGADAGQAALGKMLKALGANEDAFKSFGVEVVHAADGTIDSTATFENAVAALNKIKDPAERAAAGAKIFGKGWASMAEIIDAGAPELRKRLESVQPSKIFTDADIKSGRDTRDALDSIGDAFQGLLLTLGKSLAPAVARIAPVIAEMISKAEPAIESLGESFAQLAEDIAPAIEAVGSLLSALHELGLDSGALGMLNKLGIDMDVLTLGAIPALSKAWSALTDVQLDGTAALADDAAALKEHNSDVDRAAVLTNLAATARAVDADVTKHQTEAIEAQKAALEGDLKAQQDLIDAHRAAADSNFAVTKATNDFNDSMASLNDRVKEAKGDQGEIQQAYDDTVIAAEGVADAHQRQTEDFVKASGATATQTQKVDSWNRSMLESAASANGPLRQAILDHIARVNGIPPDKMTDINAAIDEQDIDTAQAAIDGVSQTHAAAIKADTDEASLNQANRDLDQVAHPRTVTFHAGSIKLDEFGGLAKRGDTTIAGEAGAEFARLPNGQIVLLTSPTEVPPGTAVTSARRTRRILAARRAQPRFLASGTTPDAGVTSAAPMTFVYEQNAPVYGVDDLQRELARWGQKIAQKINAGRRS